MRHVHRLGTRLDVVPVREMRRLSLAWPLPHNWEKQRALQVRESRNRASTVSERCMGTRRCRARSQAALLPFLPSLPRQSSKPARYLAHLLGHEGKGSLHSYLNSQGWIESLSAGSSVKTADMDMFKVGGRLGMMVCISSCQGAANGTNGSCALL